MVKNDDPMWIGQKFGRLCVIDLEKSKKERGWNWVVRCDCGNVKVVRPGDVKRGKIQSCGCYHDERCREKAIKFKHRTKDNKRLYEIYNGMKRRCYNPKEPRYGDYGGRGIVMCQEWLDSDNGFDKFVDWSLSNGYTDDMTIDRLDVNGNYEPPNCAWKTRKEQNNNKRQTIWVDYRGEHIQLRKLCERENVSYDTVHNRIQVLGWNIERAINEPSQQENSFAKRCREVGLSASVVKDRIKKLGWSEEEAFNTPSAGRKGGMQLAAKRCGDKYCPFCGKQFQPHHAAQIYCNAQCREAAKRIRRGQIK